ncbi:MAG: hypothetical protein ACJ763_04355 [Bdellovibrionia bacterium]
MKNLVMILSLTLASTLAHADDVITSCNRSTHLVEHRNFIGDLIQDLYPNGNCDLLPNGPNSAMGCRKAAQEAGYSCYQVSLEAYLGRASARYAVCFACID